MWRKREREKGRDGEREDLRGVRGARVGNKEDRGDEAAEGKCVNDAAPLWNVCNGCQFMPQVSITVDVAVSQGKYNALLMCAANSLGNTLSMLQP